MPADFLVTIAGMAVILASVRLAGYLLIRRIPLSPTLELWLGFLPGVTLVALVVPMVAHSGAIGLIAGVVVLAITLRFGNIVLAMAAGVAIVGLFG